MKVELHAVQDWEPPRLVRVYIGANEIAALKPVSFSRAGHGDDDDYHKSEERRIINETVGEWLRERL